MFRLLDAIGHGECIHLHYKIHTRTLVEDGSRSHDPPSPRSEAVFACHTPVTPLSPCRPSVGGPSLPLSLLPYTKSWWVANNEIEVGFKVFGVTLARPPSYNNPSPAVREEGWWGGGSSSLSPRSLASHF